MQQAEISGRFEDIARTQGNYLLDILYPEGCMTISHHHLFPDLFIFFLFLSSLAPSGSGSVLESVARGASS